MGPYGHLRSIPSATLTVAAKGTTWLQYKYELLRAGAFADDTWTWKAFKQVGCLCPIPGHSTHLQEGCLTPVVNWESLLRLYYDMTFILKKYLDIRLIAKVFNSCTRN